MRRKVMRMIDKIKTKLTGYVMMLPSLMMEDESKRREDTGKERERSRHVLENKDLRSFHPHEVLGHTQTSQHRK